MGLELRRANTNKTFVFCSQDHADLLAWAEAIRSSIAAAGLSSLYPHEFLHFVFVFAVF